VLATAVENLRVAIQDSGALVTHEALPTVQGDASQLAVLLQNLIENAIKYRGDEPPYIHLSARRLPDAWELSVADNGAGIARDDQERIFVLLQRLGHGKGVPGTGIGLATCKKIVERHGGRIWVESEPGKGATFHFTIAAPGPA
jgi:chemotaxis family two-component system sensor kinase Cph1